MKERQVKSVVFISNYFNHHQRPFSDAMYARLGDGYRFAETEEMASERKNMGWGENVVPLYVISCDIYRNHLAEVQEIIDNADVVIFGSAPRELLTNRIRANKLIFHYSERPLKNGDENWKWPVRLFTWRKVHPQKPNIYMLCASAYTAGDFAKFGLYRDRCYKWGYFPETKSYDLERLFACKQTGVPEILWCGRFLDWKHPDDAIRVAYRLKQDGYRFKMNFIGTGELETKLGEMIREYHLEDCVRMLGAMKPDQVREQMERANIYLFTSDRQEGWGAVLNESMNSGCAVVASCAIGSVPFLVKDGENGLVYKSGDVDMLYRKVRYLLDVPAEQERLGRAAYHTIVDDWNANTAAERFLKLAERILCENNLENDILSGPCSRARRLADDWYK